MLFQNILGGDFLSGDLIMPTHIVAAAGIVLNNQDQILLVKLNRAGWVFPGGQVEIGENLIDAVKREIFEESGISVEVGELFCVSSNTGKYPGYNGVKEIPTKVMFDFVCRPTGGNIRPSEENSETAWFCIEDAAKLITTPAYLERFNAWKSYCGRPSYLEYVSVPAFELKLKTFF